MYAVVATGGKQYRVDPGEVIQIEKIPGDVGDTIELDQVLLVSPDQGEILVGHPTVKGARVVGRIVAEGKTRKVIIQKFKRRKRYRRRTGHRQEYRQVRVDSIQLPS